VSAWEAVPTSVEVEAVVRNSGWIDSRRRSGKPGAGAMELKGRWVQDQRTMRSGKCKVVCVPKNAALKDLMQDAKIRMMPHRCLSPA
jgi:hypothetical protein